MVKFNLKTITKTVLLIALLAIPMLLVYYSINYYNHKSDLVINNIQPDGKIAGDKNVVIDLSDEIPIIPNSDIISVDRNNERISMTISTNKSKDEIESFYDDYFYINGWDKLEKYQYKKGVKVMKLDYNDNVIKIELTLKTN